MMLVLPLVIPSQNERDKWHWSKRHSEHRRWVKVLSFYLGRRLPPPNHRAHVVITTIRKRRISDDANLRGGAKGLVDALVEVGLLRDDSDKWVTIEYRQELAGKTSPRTLVDITKIEEPT